MPRAHIGSHLASEGASLNDMHALAVALFNAAILAHHERNPAEVERLASDLIELSTRQNFAWFLAGGEVLRGWTRCASGDTAEGLVGIEDGIDEWRLKVYSNKLGRWRTCSCPQASESLP
jgi:hypothetical protein